MTGSFAGTPCLRDSGRMRALPDPTQFRSLTEYVDSFPMPYRRAELIELWTHHQFRRAREQKRLSRLVPGVFVSPLHEADPRVRVAAVGLWLPSAIVTGHSALAFHRAEWRDPGPLTIAVGAHDRVSPRESVRVLHRMVLPESTLMGGARVAIPGAAFVDAWTLQPPESRPDLFYRALWAGVVRPTHVRRELDLRSGVADRRRLAALVGESEAGRDSWLESFARRHVFRGRSFSDFEFQVEIETGRSRRRADMCHRATRVVVELDGRRDHERAGGLRRDRLRDAELAACGYVTLRFGFAELRDSPARCRDLVLSAVAARS